ncbi:MAG: hypothetical protein FWC62_01030, partial [Firmicutes bacterium]|nr:hypothetical protein [Bacillota bacterium]
VVNGRRMNILAEELSDFNIAALYAGVVINRGLTVKPCADCGRLFIPLHGEKICPRHAQINTEAVR